MDRPDRTDSTARRHALHPDTLALELELELEHISDAAPDGDFEEVTPELLAVAHAIWDHLEAWAIRVRPLGDVVEQSDEELGVQLHCLVAYIVGAHTLAEDLDR